MHTSYSANGLILPTFSPTVLGRIFHDTTHHTVMIDYQSALYIFLSIKNQVDVKANIIFDVGRNYILTRISFIWDFFYSQYFKPYPV